MVGGSAQGHQTPQSGPQHNTPICTNTHICTNTPTSYQHTCVALLMLRLTSTCSSSQALSLLSPSCHAANRTNCAPSLRVSSVNASTLPRPKALGPPGAHTGPVVAPVPSVSSNHTVASVPAPRWLAVWNATCRCGWWGCVIERRWWGWLKGDWMCKQGLTPNQAAAATQSAHRHLLCCL